MPRKRDLEAEIITLPISYKRPKSSNLDLEYVSVNYLQLRQNLLLPRLSSLPSLTLERIKDQPQLSHQFFHLLHLYQRQDTKALQIWRLPALLPDKDPVLLLDRNQCPFFL